jgi:hypothetical protein
MAQFRHMLPRAGSARLIDLDTSAIAAGGERSSHRYFPGSSMSETIAAAPADPVHLVWSTLREQGFDAAQLCAVALAHKSA